jgi:glycosyltransferase involved in cell wall biosynthesis
MSRHDLPSTAPSANPPSEAMNKPFLSICIPTYNRVNALEKLVLRILECAAVDIEVVVLDNGSSDQTITQLSAIPDQRLSIHSNGTNRGVLFNVVNVLLKARGAYCMLLLDKDHIDPSQIIAFRAFLARERVACGFCEYGPPSGQAPEVLTKGFETLRRVAYVCHHPTGYFFDTSLLQQLETTTRFIDYDLVGHFPFEFIFAELALRGRGAIYHAPLVSPETLVAAGANKSFGTNASKEDAFFSPNGRLKMAINFSRHIQSLPISSPEKRWLIVDRFMQGLMAATVGFRSILANDDLCRHYHMTRRKVGRAEMIRIAIDFYRKFVSAIFAPTWATAWFWHGRFVFELLVRNSRRFIARHIGAA